MNYQVNALGQRYGKTIGLAATAYLYDKAGHLIAESSDGGLTYTEYIWLNDSPVGVIKPNIVAPIFAYIHPDHLNTPRLIANATPATVWRWDNDDPFGGNMANSNPGGLGTFTFNLRYPGQYFDSETNNHYNYYRDYSPEIGRYVEADPIGVLGLAERHGHVDLRPLSALRLDSIEALLADAETIAIIRQVTAAPLEFQTTFNLYAYVEGKPLSVTDPTGQIGVLPLPRGGKSSIEICGASDRTSCYKMCSAIGNAMGDERGKVFEARCFARCFVLRGFL